MSLRPDEKVALVDLDGTIVTYDDGFPGMHNFGAIKADAKEALISMKCDGWEIIVHTSRHWVERKSIFHLLVEHGIPFDSIICGKPVGAVYIDDRAVGDGANWSKVLKHLGLEDIRLSTLQNANHTLDRYSGEGA